MKSLFMPLRPWLQRILDAMAFDNAGNFREFEEMLRESSRRERMRRRRAPGYRGPATSRRSQAAVPAPSGARLVLLKSTF